MASIADIRVLIIDDSRQMRMLLRGMLMAGGLSHIREAESGAEGLRLLQQRTDLVLVDWQMAPMDGIEFTRTVRRGPESRNPYLPIIMISAHTEAARVAAARDAGVTAFVKKPVSPHMLFSRMASALTDTRLFVQCDGFFGPDRRRFQAPNYAGPFRRATDAVGGGSGDTFDLDDLPLSA